MFLRTVTFTCIQVISQLDPLRYFFSYEMWWAYLLLCFCIHNNLIFIYLPDRRWDSKFYAFKACLLSLSHNRLFLSSPFNPHRVEDLREILCHSSHPLTKTWLNIALTSVLSLVYTSKYRMKCVPLSHTELDSQHCENGPHCRGFTSRLTCRHFYVGCIS
jgi:hypothetical protein